MVNARRISFNGYILHLLYYEKLFFLTDPSNMGGLSMLMEGIQVKSNQFTAVKNVEQNTKPVILPLLTGISPFQSWTSQQVN